jgi:hypothetical protein
LADLAQQLGVREADLRQALGAAQANVTLGLGTRAADLSRTLGTNLAGMRTRAGELAERGYIDVFGGLSDLQREMGIGGQDLIGRQTDYLNQLYQSAAQGNAAAQTRLAELQAEGYSAMGSQLSGTPYAKQFVGQSPLSGALGGAVVGAKIAEMIPGQQQTTQTDTQPSGRFEIGSYFPQGYFNQPYTATSGATVYPGNVQFGGNVSSTGIIRSPIAQGFS